ncbi:16S rRNA (cytosine967-C5)-methyltransferase [Ketogulonicigenium robustum]|uniref:16S rRNA (Cytosine967-C5)-methyltransferase n=2 Tax=Ketogulonicigenium robustum TaxID=92947 RepID=A0A1W6NZL8_9RHOB|nr:16S rRNA (cytosine967-C5)-methyltransferase [Ketogulonicigenium robustum]
MILAGEPAERALITWARGNRYAGSGDRSAVRDLVYDALRKRGSYAYLGGALNGRGLMIGALRAAGQDPATLFTGATYAPPTLSADELAAPTTLPDSGPARWNMPEDMIAAFTQSLGADAPAAMDVLSQRADVHLRVNTKRATREAVQTSLAAEGIETALHPQVETALIATKNARRIQTAQAYTQGLVELQDAASQAAILRLPLQDGMRVLDYCAGGGGKALAMAARAKLQVFAHDAAPQRMNDIPARAARAGVKIERLSGAEIAKAAPYDLVLVDAPCSGSGTWRRTPDAKWRFGISQVENLVTLQGQILFKAAQLVARGGILAYATCSVLRDENEAQVARFLEDVPQFRQIDTLGLRPQAEWDGFFLAVLVRSETT